MPEDTTPTVSSEVEAAEQPTTTGEPESAQNPGTTADTKSTEDPGTTADQPPSTTGDTKSTENLGVTGERLVLPKRLVFRVPGTAYVAVAFFVMCASSVALVSRYFALIYLVPLAMVFWIMRTRTEVDAERIVVRRVLSRTSIPWSKVKSLRLSDKGWVRAVRTDSDAEIALPTVRTRHLPALALISGGRISDPTAPKPDQPVYETEKELPPDGSDGVE